jgi:small subunit ribosomal protein S18
MTDRGKIAPRRMTGCCALHQRMVAKTLKRSRTMGLVPYLVD